MIKPRRIHVALMFSSVLALASAGLAVGAGPASASDLSLTFSYNGSTGADGSPQTWTVPAGVRSATFDLKGASGGDAPIDTLGGRGGHVVATLAVTPGQTFTIMVGGRGGDATLRQDGSSAPGGAGGYNGGGPGGDAPAYSTSVSAGGGGGATDVRARGTGLQHRFLVAAGGGGAAGPDDGGDGGSDSGAPGLFVPSVGFGGGGGTQTRGGRHVVGTEGTATDGTFGQGGRGGTEPGMPNSSGAGGGGGYFGGGGSDYVTVGGGGGGSSFIDPLVSIQVNDQGANTGNGSLTISWSSPSSK